MSGTLQTLGIHVPQPEVKADDTNPKGFGEPQWVVDLHDELLKRCARLLQLELREEDIKARLGDGEFAVMLPETPIDEALPLLDRLRLRVGGSEFNVGGVVVTTTLSAGATLWTKDVASRDQLLKSLDGALYKARHGGRNRVASM